MVLAARLYRYLSGTLIHGLKVLTISSISVNGIKSRICSCSSFIKYMAFSDHDTFLVCQLLLHEMRLMERYQFDRVSSKPVEHELGQGSLHRPLLGMPATFLEKIEHLCSPDSFGGPLKSKAFFGLIKPASGDNHDLRVDCCAAAIGDGFNFPDTKI